jgi:DNA-binding GntR family transcriptional regulator
MPIQLWPLFAFSSFSATSRPPQFSRQPDTLRLVTGVLGLPQPGYLQKVERDHRQIVKAMEGKNHDSLVEVVRNHLPDSRDAYLRAYAVRHGTGFPELRDKTAD